MGGVHVPGQGQCWPDAALGSRRLPPTWGPPAHALAVLTGLASGVQGASPEAPVHPCPRYLVKPISHQRGWGTPATPGGPGRGLGAPRSLGPWPALAKLHLESNVQVRPRLCTCSQEHLLLWIPETTPHPGRRAGQGTPGTAHAFPPRSWEPREWGPPSLMLPEKTHIAGRRTPPSRATPGHTGPAKSVPGHCTCAVPSVWHVLPAEPVTTASGDTGGTLKTQVLRAAAATVGKRHSGTRVPGPYHPCLQETAPPRRGSQDPERGQRSVLGEGLCCGRRAVALSVC